VGVFVNTISHMYMQSCVIIVTLLIVETILITFPLYDRRI